MPVTLLSHLVTDSMVVLLSLVAETDTEKKKLLNKIVIYLFFLQTKRILIVSFN